MAIKTFTTGEVLTAADTNTFLANSGLVFVKSQTVGSGVSSVEITSAFSATYDHYRIIWSGGTLSALALIGVYMGNAAAANGYYGARVYSTMTPTVGSTADNNVGQWQNMNAGGTAAADTIFELYNPHASTETLIQSTYWELNGASSNFGTYTGILNNTTSYTSCTIDPQGATTMSGGTITVYGYRKA
jgi:hypothetical protein